MPPAAQKHALLIGNDRYQELPDLKVPAADVAGLARVLTDPAIGGFAPALVKTLANPDYAVAHRAIGRLFANRQRDDLVLLYFSGHGELDHRTGRLYLALPDSERDCLDGTALADTFITTVMDRSPAGRQILILDCCYAGAIGRKGAVVTAATFGTDPAAPPPDAGYGRVILTSSTAGESSWEGNRVIAGVERSLFTHFLIQGLETGEAAAGAPAVSVEQLYRYVHAAVVKATAAGPRRMTPERFGQVRGELILARNPQARAPAPDPKDLLGADLLADLASENHRTRIGAVGELANLIHQAPLRQVVIAVLEDYNGCGAKTGVYRQQTLPVDSLAANPWGLHHVAGNVWEWTCSAYADLYDGKETACISKNDANTWPNRVIRGGAWDNQPAWLRSANRFWLWPSARYVTLGFRLAQDL